MWWEKNNFFRKREQTNKKCKRMLFKSCYMKYLDRNNNNIIKQVEPDIVNRYHKANIKNQVSSK